MRISQRARAVQTANFLLVLMGGVAFSPNAHADSILVAAPSAGGSYYGMYCTRCIGAEFTLAGSYNVSTIDVVLRTPTTTGFTTFDFSLLSSATNTIFTEALTAPLGGENTEVMNVNEILSAGTYYLVGNVPGYAGTTVTPGDVDGWVLSAGIYNEADGTVTNGVGSFVGTTWTENTSPGLTTPAFTVNGSASTSTPEPSSVSMMFVGLLVGFVTRGGLILRHHV